jgi:hypothetical protein|tara:strand:+ start:738 stop:4754 length:4017 start_codon:yes stop_codon:yes gene_type:complete
MATTIKAQVQYSSTSSPTYETDFVILELSDDQPVNANYQFKDIQDFSNNKGSHTYNFRVPSTPRNDMFFNQYFEVTQSGNYNPKVKVNATIQKDGLDIFRGYLQLVNVYCKNDDAYSYECIVFNNIGQLGQLLSARKLSSFDWDTYDHLMTINNITESMNRDVTPFKNGDIVYSLFDYGSMFVGGDEVGSIQMTQSPIDVRKLKPQLRVSKIFSTIMEQIGYTYESDFIDNEITDLYMDLNNGEYSINTLNQDYYNINANTVGQTAQTFTSELFQTIPLEFSNATLNSSGNWDTSTSVYSPDNLWNEVQIQCTISLDVSPSTGLDSNSTFRLMVWEVNGAGNLVDSIYSSPLTAIYDDGTGASSFIWFQESLAIDTSLEYQIVLQQWNPSASAGNTLTVLVGQLQITPLASEGLPYYVPNGLQVMGLNASFTFKTALNMPDMNAIDFVTSLCKKFNLVVIPDEFIDTHFQIIPYKDWIDMGNDVDWTSKLDTSKDVQLKPTVELQAKNLTFTDDKSDDAWNKMFFNASSRIYGSVEIQNDNDFGKDKQEIKTVFKPTITRFIWGTGFKNTICYEEGDKNAGGARLSWYCGYQYSTTVVGEMYYLREGETGGSQGNSKYAVLQNWKDAEPTSTTEAISFQGEYTYELGYPLTQGVYNTYWRRFVEETYSRDARLLVGHFHLTSIDIMSMNFNDIVLVKNEFFRINKITNYPLMGTGTCKVELIKVKRSPLLVLPDAIDCEASFTGGINADGTTIWNDNNNWGSTPVIPTESCCIAQGFTFVDGNCYNIPYGGKPPKPDIQNDSSLGGNNAMTGIMNHVVGHNNNISSFSTIKGSQNTMDINSSHMEISGDENLVFDGTTRSKITGSNNKLQPYSMQLDGTRLKTFVLQSHKNTNMIGDYGISLASGDVFISGGADKLYNTVGRSGSGQFIKQGWTTGEETILIGQNGEFTLDRTSNDLFFSSQGTNMFRLQYPSYITFEVTIGGHNRGTTTHRSQLFSFRKYVGVIQNTNNSGNINAKETTIEIQKESSDFSNYQFKIVNGISTFQDSQYIDDGMFCFSINTNGCTKLDDVDWTIDFKYTLIGLQNMGRSAGSTIFAPTSINGCLLWLDASDYSTLTFDTGSTSDVEQWDDKSGNNHHVQVVVNGSFPTYNDEIFDPFLQFGASNVGMVNLDSSLYNYSDTENTIFVVFKADTSSDGGRYGHHIAGDSYRGRQSNGIFGEANSDLGGGGVGHIGYCNNGGDRTCDSNNIAPTTKQVVCGTFDGSSTCKFYNQNGLQTTTSTGVTTSSKDQFAVGGGKFSSTVVNSEFDGKIYEVIAYDTELTDAQREQVFNYLTTKWNT